MNILKIGKQSPNVSFGANQKPNESAVHLFEKAKDAAKNLKNKKIKLPQDYAEISEIYKSAEKQAKNELSERLAKNKFERKIDNFLDKSFTWTVKTFGKSNKLISKVQNGVKKTDIGTAVVGAVAIGNVLKEMMGTTLYTVQAFTNDDLPKDKRKFVGLYDLFVGLISTTVSLILGPGLMKKINNYYKSNLKSLEHMPKQVAVVAGLSAFTTFALQTIVGKRIIAPAIATPLAGKMKRKMELKEQKKIDASIPPEHDVLLSNTSVNSSIPIKKNGFVDLNQYIEMLKQNKQA